MALLSEELYNIAKHSPIHAHIRSLTAVSTTQGESQLVRSSLGEVFCSGTPRHSARRSRGSNWQPSGYQLTRSTSWVTAARLLYIDGLYNSIYIELLDEHSSTCYVQLNVH